MKTAMWIIVVIAVLACAIAAYCQGGTGGPGGPPPRPPMAVMPPPPADKIDPIAQALGLTTDQATALKAVLETSDATMQPLMQAAGDADKALHEAFAAGDFTAAADLASAATDAQLAAIKGGLTAWANIKASGTLTDDQFAKLLAGPGGPPPAEGGSGSGSGSGSNSSSRRGHK
jgi:hypothetical protein